ncbi:hypothetical protein EU528_14045 [Candidatus Thorarchaeota archaeon]|nr:MAG: hypothetical protein EU528_14045 [Candidatus Thorarchaeota archaeon]
MRVEIDASEVEYGLYYRDESSKELEKLLQNDPRYAECEVQRVQWGDVNTNPFDVLDENEESIVLLETWEVNTLTPPELISYIEVKQKIDRPLSDADAALYGSAIALGLTAGLFAFLLIFEERTMNLAFMIIPVFILAPILGFLSVRTYRKSIRESRNADLDAVRRDSSFLDVLQRLAQVPEIKEYNRKKLLKRIENIEQALSGI